MNDPAHNPNARNTGMSPLRIAGLVVACSTPISGFLSYAAVAILAGESQMEGSAGLTPLGLAVFGAPLVLGVLLVLISFLTDRTPSLRALAVAAGVASVASLGVGLWSAVSAKGDASIGGGLLVVAAIGLAVASVALFRAAGKRKNP